MNARALALKAGAVLATLISSRAFGTRPLSLTGYSLGSLVIFEALRILSQNTTDHLSSQTAHLISDVFLFGTPVSTDPRPWSSVRRLVSGRLVNGYSAQDYVLAVLSRASDATSSLVMGAGWGVAGLGKVDVQGVENVDCAEWGVDGHLKWRGCVGRCLVEVGTRSVSREEAERLEVEVGEVDGREMDMGEEEVKRTLREGIGEVMEGSEGGREGGPEVVMSERSGKT